MDRDPGQPRTTASGCGLSGPRCCMACHRRIMPTTLSRCGLNLNRI